MGRKKGYKPTRETKKKISNTLKGTIPWNKGKKLSIKAKENMSNGRKGMKLSEEHKKNISKANSNPSKEKRKKLSEAQKGKTLSEKTKKKISISNKGKKLSKRTKRKMSETRKRLLKEGKIKTPLNVFKKGKDNLNWNGGSSFEPYDKNFNNKFKRFIRDRDNQVCMLCGIHREKLKKALAVHHIDYNKSNTCKENCCALCNDCNLNKVNTNREEWTIFFQSILNKRYGYEYKKEVKDESMGFLASNKIL